MEYKTMEKKLNDDNFVNKENLDKLKMNYSADIGNLKLVSFDVDCPSIINYTSSTDIDQECSPIVDGLVIEASCYDDSCELVVSFNHEYSMKFILDSHIVQERDNDADISILEEEINIQDIPLLTQPPTFCLKKENNLEEEHGDCGTMPSMMPTDPQSITNFLK
jgi:hypothetical protein